MSHPNFSPSQLERWGVEPGGPGRELRHHVPTSPSLHAFEVPLESCHTLAVYAIAAASAAAAGRGGGRGILGQQGAQDGFRGAEGEGLHRLEPVVSLACDPTWVFDVQANMHSNRVVLPPRLTDKQTVISSSARTKPAAAHASGCEPATSTVSQNMSIPQF